VSEPLSPELLNKMNAYWRAANYLSVGQIYLQENPLLERPLSMDDIKPRLLGHWGTTPGLNFLYVHLNRIIAKNNVNMIYIIGPGHGGPGLVANTYLEGSYTEIYPHVEQSKDGIRRLFRQFSWPYGIPSHVAPETPGSIHEGGELGYSLSHAYGAALDNPDLIVACVVGDGEAERQVPGVEHEPGDRRGERVATGQHDAQRGELGAAREDEHGKRDGHPPGQPAADAGSAEGDAEDAAFQCACAGICSIK